MAQNRGGTDRPQGENVVYSSSPTSNTVITREETAAPRPVDLVRWGPIIAGLLAALSTLAVLGVLGLAIGLGNYNPGDRLSSFGFGAGIWSALSVLIAFAVGGFLAARSAAVSGHGNGILNGAMVWFVAIPLLLYLLGSGVSALVGTATNVASTAVVAGGQAVSNPTIAATVQAGGQEALQGAQATAQALATSVTPQDVKNATNTASNTAWATLLSLGLSAAAAIGGGYLGARPSPQKETHVSVTRT